MPKKKTALLFVLSLFLLSLLFQEVCKRGIEKGLVIALSSALPSLFPFLVLSSLLTSLLGSEDGKFVKKLPLFLGLLCGFPIGGKTVCELYEKKRLSEREAKRLLFCCNNTGPAFIVSLCGKGIFHSEKIGWMIFTLEVICVLFLYFSSFLFYKKEKNSTPPEKKNAVPFSPSREVVEAIRNGILSFLYISGFILFFSFFCELIFSFSFFRENALFSSVLFLFSEICGGISSLSSLPFSLALPLCGAGIGWAGLSVHLQTLVFIDRAGLNRKPYFLGKALLSVLMGLGAIILTKVL